jgi:hypothetical protein
MVMGAALEGLVRHEVLTFTEDTDHDADEVVIRRWRATRCVVIAPAANGGEGEGRRMRPVAGIAVRDAGSAQIPKTRCDQARSRFREARSLHDVSKGRKNSHVVVRSIVLSSAIHTSARRRARYEQIVSEILYKQEKQRDRTVRLEER